VVSSNRNTNKNTNTTLNLNDLYVLETGSFKVCCPAELIPKGNARDLDNGRYYLNKLINPYKGSEA